MKSNWKKVKDFLVQDKKPSTSSYLDKLQLFLMSSYRWSTEEFGGGFPFRDVMSNIFYFAFRMSNYLEFNHYGEYYSDCIIKDDLGDKKSLKFIPKSQVHRAIFTDPIEMFSSQICMNFDLLEIYNCFFGVCCPNINFEQSCYTQEKSWTLQIQQDLKLYVWSTDRDRKALEVYHYNKEESHPIGWGSPFSIKDLDLIETGDVVTVRVIANQKDKKVVNVEYLINHKAICRLDDIPLPLCFMISPYMGCELNYYLSW